MNVESAVAESFADLGYWCTRTGTDLQSQIMAHGAVIRASQVGGPVDDWQGRYRFVIEAYAATYATMWATADEITKRLVKPPLWADLVLIDNTFCEGSFAERPYAEGTRVVVSTWLLTVRHHTRRAVAAPE